ncbi:hypothetical protein QAD02_017495 [Eretmocerus hayati]|uniref:Uncharacterized protein n=1 Tax=Eretmocerus hayati TaxID=131215 RepID=A0ACC2PF64_9HYME|nr:hypothetical protein QAD02_017495 [Eretmocerus hayati]
METGLVIDFEVLSKYCQMCTTTAAELDSSSPDFNLWHENHIASGECNINYKGSSGGMEAEAAVIIWSRSEEQHGLRYTKMNSDGDTKTQTKLNEIQPYGPLVYIEKEECINHVHKRMGKGLRDLATKEKLGGKKAGALTVKKIDMLQKYYGKAIRNNLPDVPAMKRAILATLDHCSSTDAKHNHKLCPDGPDSWCFFKKALALKQKPKSHQRMAVKLRKDVVRKMKPLYTRLSDDELLQRCTMGETQNANESLHAQIWRRCPKEVFVSKRRVHMAVVNAVLEHNYGIMQSLEIRNSIRGEEIPDVAMKVSHQRETERSKRKEYQDDYRHSKRARKCAQKYDGLRGRNRESSEEYCSGKF